MVVLVIAILAVPLCWLFVQRTLRVDPVARRAGVTWAVSCLGAGLAFRTGLAPLGLLLTAVCMGSIFVWLRRRGGGDDPGDDGRDEPVEPGPDPGPHHGLVLPAELGVLDHDAFDRARAEWERRVPERT